MNMYSLRLACRVSLLVAAVALAGGCPKETKVEPAAAQPARGNFTATSCAEAERTSLPTGAAYAIYIDGDGNPLGDRLEDLKGTSDNKMCPTPPAQDTGDCPIGYCSYTIPGTTTKSCKRC